MSWYPAPQCDSNSSPMSSPCLTTVLSRLCVDRWTKVNKTTALLSLATPRLGYYFGVTTYYREQNPPYFRTSKEEEVSLSRGSPLHHLTKRSTIVLRVSRSMAADWPSKVLSTPTRDSNPSSLCITSVTHLYLDHRLGCKTNRWYSSEKLWLEHCAVHVQSLVCKARSRTFIKHSWPEVQRWRNSNSEVVVN